MSNPPPKVRTAAKRQKQVNFRFTDEEMARVEAASKLVGLARGPFIRSTVLERVRMLECGGNENAIPTGEGEENEHEKRS